MKKLLVIGLAFVFVFILTKCGGEAEADEQELLDAQNLLAGLNMLGTMTDTSGMATSREPMSPPLGWAGPDTFDLPEGTNDVFYQFIVKFPLDSMQTTIDSVIWLFTFVPDIWNSLYQDSLVIGFESWLIGDTRDDIYFHTTIDALDSIHVTGELKWNWTETWWTYAFDNSVINETAEIDINSSTNIRISAHFLFDENGAGELEDNWGKFQEITFVKYQFFAEDSAGYDGFYQLLSEDWKVDHYFTLTTNG